MGVEEEEEEGPVWVQGGNQHKPEGGVGGGWLAAGGSGPPPCPHWLTSPAPALISMEGLGGMTKILFLLPALSRM